MADIFPHSKSWKNLDASLVAVLRQFPQIFKLAASFHQAEGCKISARFGLVESKILVAAAASCQMNPAEMHNENDNCI